MKILVPRSLDLRFGTAGSLDLIDYDPAEPLPPEHPDAEILVTWDNTSANLADAAGKLPRLRLVQALATGVEKMLAAPFLPDVRMASGHSLQNDTVSEHALALALALVRDLPGLARAQHRAQWSDELRLAQIDEQRPPRRTLHDANVVIWGFGGIGRTLARLFEALGSNVFGVARSARDVDGFAVSAVSDLPGLLPKADVLVMILPDLPENRRALSAERLSLLREGAWVVNVGRGATIDEAALLQALDSSRVAGAALDVFETEPLPSESPLWSHPNVIVTPHVAGGRLRGAAQLIAANVARLADGRPLINEISRPASTSKQLA